MEEQVRSFSSCFQKPHNTEKKFPYDLKSKQKIIRDQTIKMNALLDWNNEYFTMDKVFGKQIKIKIS